MARLKGDHDVRRAEIAEAACAVILDVGIEHTKLRDIAERLGCTTGVIQHYFPDKETLLMHAKNRLFDGAFDRVRAAATGPDVHSRLRAMAMELMPLDRRRVEMYQLLAAFRGRAVGQPHLMVLQRKRDQLGCRLFADELRGLKAAMGPQVAFDPEVEAVLLVACFEGIATQLLMGAKPLTRKQMEAALDAHMTARLGLG